MHGNLGTGVNYSINEVYENVPRKNLVSECVYIPDQTRKLPRKTLRENDDTLERLEWKPEDRLSDYIKSL